MGKENKENKKNSGLLVACWFLLLLLLLILFFIKKDMIVANLEKADFFAKVFGKSVELSKNEESKDDNKKDSFEFNLSEKKGNEGKKEVYEEATGSESVKAVQKDAVIISEDITSNLSNANANKEKTEVSKNADESKANISESSKNAAIASNPSDTVAPTATSRDITLFFVSIDPNGGVSRKPVKRTLPKSDSPLTDSIKALISGPIPSETSKNCMSLIPQGTRLLGASVKNNVATLNFSEQFEFNSLGVEGYIAQLMQVVYTATEFNTVSSVQILIEGEKRDYLGIEAGQWIGSPLSRNSF